jgi:hypothetical protein
MPVRFQSEIPFPRMSKGSSGAGDVRMELREGKWLRLYDHFFAFGTIALVSLGALSKAVPENLSLPTLWFGYFAATALTACVTAFASATVFKKTVTLRDDSLDVRRIWGTTVWKLDSVDGEPHLDVRGRGYFDLIFFYRSSSAAQSARRVSIPLVYIDGQSSKALLAAVISARADFHVAKHRAEFLKRRNAG